MAAEDREWLSRPDTDGVRKFRTDSTESILPGVTLIKGGGHFPGSQVLHYQKLLLTADTIVARPSGLYHIDRPPGTTSYAFMWSIPNMIPLGPREMLGIWRAIKSLEFETTYGVMFSDVIRSKRLKSRVLESMKIQVRAEGYTQHELLDEKCPGED